MKKRRKKRDKLNNPKVSLYRNKNLTALSFDNNQRQKTIQTETVSNEIFQNKSFDYFRDSLFSRSLKFIAWVEIIIALPFIYFAHSLPSFLEKVPDFILSMTGTICSSAFISHFLILLCFIIFPKTVLFNAAFRKRCLFLFKLWSVLVIASIFLTSLYAIGAVDGLTDFVKFILPIVGQNISYGISTFITWVISGVIGNVAYALLRKLFYKMQERNTSNSGEEMTK